MMVRFLMVIAVGFVTSMSSQVLASECFTDSTLKDLNRDRVAIFGRSASCLISESKILGELCLEGAAPPLKIRSFTGNGWCTARSTGEHAGHTRGLQLIHPDLGHLRCKISVYEDYEKGQQIECIVHGSTSNNIDRYALPPRDK